MTDSNLLRKIQNFGALNTEIDSIPLLLNLDNVQTNSLIIAFQDEHSEISRAYKTGQAMSDYNREAAIEKQAETGDSFALQSQYHYRKQKQVNQLKKKYFNINCT